MKAAQVKVLLHSPWIGWAMNQGAHSVLTVSENTGESERSRNGDEKLSGCKNKTVKDFRNKKWCNHYGLHLNRGGEAVGGYEKASSWGKEKKKKRIHGIEVEMGICLWECMWITGAFLFYAPASAAGNGAQQQNFPQNICNLMHCHQVYVCCKNAADDLYPENVRKSNKNIHIQRCNLTSLRFGFDSCKVELL